jgi:hypothetical protein
MKKLIVIFLGLSLLLPACLDDPITGPETPEAGLIFYNNLLEADKVLWKVDETVSTVGQAYGVPIPGAVEVDGFAQQTRFVASTLDGGIGLDSFDLFLDPYRYYMISVMGTEEEPLLVSDTIDTSFPTLGLVKMRFLHASEAMGAVDIYVGGELPEHRKLTGITYGEISVYVEDTQESFWNAVIVTPADMTPGDSTLLSYTVNKNFIPNKSYFGIINHAEADPESSFRMQVFNQPSF